MERNPNQDALNLEEAFFVQENARLLEQMRKKAEIAERRELLRRVVGIQDDAFLDRLIALGIGPERAMVLRLTPLVFVAWADGSVDENERQAILRAAAREGVVAEEMARQVLGDWLSRKPDRRILDMWKEYIRHVWERFTSEEQEQLRRNLLDATREVAKAAGGFLGIAAISAAERKMLEELESVVR
jgi:hypothetical protein